MASVDGSRSLLAVCDEWFDFECGPCKDDSAKREARYYCENCLEYLCDHCQGFHRKLPLTKNHRIVSGNQMPGTTSVKRVPRILITCGCNKNQEVVFYCLDHNDVVCDPCKSIKHHNCKTTSIQNESASYSKTALEELMSKMKSIKDDFDRMKKENESNTKELERLKESCRRDIEAFRNEINIFLDRLEKDMLRQLDIYEEEFQKRINQRNSTLKSLSQMIETDYKLLEKAKTDGRKEAMFASDVQISKSLNDYKLRPADIASENIKPVMSFQRNEGLTNLIKEIKTFGEIKITEEFPRKNVDTVVLLGRKVQSTRKVDVRERDDSREPHITGIAVMPTCNGYTVLCDQSNEKMKLIDSSWTLKESLKLSDPFDVTVFDDNNVIITKPNNKQLQYIQVFPVLQAGRVLQLDKKCWGVAVGDEKIFVTCHQRDREGEVRILDFNGNTLSRIGINQKGSFMFKKPYYIFCSSGEKVFISDWDTNTISCMTADGLVIYTYTDSDLSGPNGILCDGGGNVFVCGQNSHNAQVITADGKKYGTLLSSKDGPNYPYAIAYSRKDDSFIIGGHSAELVCANLIGDKRNPHYDVINRPLGLFGWLKK